MHPPEGLMSKKEELGVHMCLHKHACINAEARTISHSSKSSSTTVQWCCGATLRDDIICTLMCSFESTEHLEWLLRNARQIQKQASLSTPCCFRISSGATVDLVVPGVAMPGRGRHAYRMCCCRDGPGKRQEQSPWLVSPFLSLTPLVCCRARTRQHVPVASLTPAGSASVHTRTFA